MPLAFDQFSSPREGKEVYKIIQQSMKVIPIYVIYPLSITIDTIVVEEIRDNPLVITSKSVAFTEASKQNLKNMVQEIEDYKKTLVD